MSDPRTMLASAQQTIRELEKLTKWPPEEERYLYGEKPDVCLYRQMPEEFTYNKHVSKHADHLTRENLRGKWELCMELGWRDAEIERLQRWQDFVRFNSKEAAHMADEAIRQEVESDE